MSDDVLKELVDRVLNDSKFRNEVVGDIDGALIKYGYTGRLSQEEIAAIKEFHAKNKDLSPVELNSRPSDAVSGKQGIFA